MTKDNQAKNIILVHGLFMSGVVMVKLRNFLKEHGYTNTIFSYRTVRDAPEKGAEQLRLLIESFNEPSIIICHSLGGLLVQKALASLQNPEQKVQKVISMGTPWQGASILTFMQQYHLDSIVGKSLEILLPKENNEWQFSNISLGSIAGKSTIGARVLFAPGKKIPTDGTVTIDETKIKGMTDHTIIPISHTGLIFSNLAAQKCLEFIKTNHFDNIS